MSTHELEKLRYPIGQFTLPRKFDEHYFENSIRVLEELPLKLEGLVSHLNNDQLDTPYRPEGWTIRQVIHHIADSHHHCYVRFKWTLTEDTPTIKAYNEADWAELFDGKYAPIQMSLDHIKAIHVKLVYLLKGLSHSDVERSFIHPENNRTIPMKVQLGIYAWHSAHHYAHIENLIKRKGWN